MSWICFHIENERLLKNTVSEEIRVECDKLFRQRGYEERGRWIPEKEVILSYIVEGILCRSQDNGPIWEKLCVCSNFSILSSKREVL